MPPRRADRPPVRKRAREPSATLAVPTGASATITFAVPGRSGPLLPPGRAAPLMAPALPGSVKASVRVEARRDGGALTTVTAVPGDDIVALHIANGPVLLLHPATARDLLNGPGALRAAGSGAVAVDPLLHWPGTLAAGSAAAGGGARDTHGDADGAHGAEGTRGAQGTRGNEAATPRRVVLAGFQLLTGLAKDRAVTFATSDIVRRIDGQVDAGVYALQPDRLDALKGSGRKLDRIAAAGDAPILVLLHGSFVDTAATFGALWQEHGAQVRRLFAHYRGQVFALDHPTLGASPVANARLLVDALPAGARLHLVSHSRGGLVAEVLARVAGQRGAIGAADLDFFSDAAERSELRALAALVGAKGVLVDRVVRVACPAHGTLLAARRLDAYLSVLQWLLLAAGVPVLPALVDFIAEVARRRADPVELPGLAAMMPGSPLLAWLDARPSAQAEGQMRARPVTHQTREIGTTRKTRKTRGTGGTRGTSETEHAERTGEAGQAEGAAEAAGPAAIPGTLRVVAGDLEVGGGVLGWLKALLADAYFWTANDTVVQTRSMYGGALRAGGASFLLDRGPGATHFRYFANPGTAVAVVDALVDAEPAGFRPIGPLSRAGGDAGGVRGQPPAAGSRHAPGLQANVQVQVQEQQQAQAQLQPQAPDPAKPALVVLLPDGPGSASPLLAFLAASHDIVRFAWGWEQPLQHHAARLATQVRAALDLRRASGQPVRLLAHGSGGLLARTLQIADPATWQRLLAHAEARVLLLGVPHGGCWMPMQLLSGDRSAGAVADPAGSPVVQSRDRERLAQLPGLLQLQASLLDPVLALARQASWQALADRDEDDALQRNWWQRQADALLRAACRWGVPSQAVLDQAVDLRRLLDAQLDPQRGGALLAAAPKLRQVLGAARCTPVGFVADGDGFAYLDAVDGGDGCVPSALAVLPGVAGWKLPLPHAELVGASSAFDAYLELLVAGSTARLPALEASKAVAPAAGASGASGTSGTSADMPAAPALQHLRRRPAREPAALPAGAEAAAEAAAETAADRAPGALPTGRDRRDAAGTAPPALQLAVLNGNLSHLRQPLLLGHYSALQLTGTEAVVDASLGGTLRAALAAGIYPDGIGSYQIFENTRRDDANPWALPRPSAAIVVGLGPEGDLTAAGLAEAVCQGVKAWSQRAAERAAAAAAAAPAAPLEPPELPEPAGPSGSPDGTSPPPPPGIDLAATLIGSGGIGVSAGESARSIARGVRLANERLVGSGWPAVARLTLVELYLDRAGDAWRGLRVLAQAGPGAYALAPTIASGTGPMRRQPDSGYRGADYDLIDASTGDDGSITFALDTRRARTELRVRRPQLPLVRSLIALAAADAAADASALVAADGAADGAADAVLDAVGGAGVVLAGAPTDAAQRLGRTLFQLLVPLELAPFLGGTERLLLQLDAGTAAIPWELLDTRPADGSASAAAFAGVFAGDQRPWAIRTQLLRKLKTANFRAAPRDATADAAVLVVGEPLVDDPSYPPLPGARREAAAVAQLFAGAGGVGAARVTALLDRAPAAAVVGALLERPYRVVHLAGHGAPPLSPAGAGSDVAAGNAAPAGATAPFAAGADTSTHASANTSANTSANARGVVLSGGVFLGPDEIASMRTVPELVFVNCCHLGGHDVGQVLAPPPRSALSEPAVFAATLADALIKLGVRCVVAAGWAVDDAAAAVFAQTFYRALLSGHPLVEAVAAARSAARDSAPGSNTWAAYQCYGDPDWVFHDRPADAQTARPPHDPSSAVLDAIVSTPGLALTLENLAVRARFDAHPDAAAGARAQQAMRQQLRMLEAAGDAGGWLAMGAVAEAFAVAWEAVGERDAAIAWFARAVAAPDGSASLQAQQQLGNLRVRLAWQQAQRALQQADGIADARTALQAAVHEMAALAAMAGHVPTVERLSLCGAAWKRLGLLERRDGRPGAADAAFKQARDAYAGAETLAAAGGAADLHWPALNRIALDLVLASSRTLPGRQPRRQRGAASGLGLGLDPAAFARARASLQRQLTTAPDFWSVVGTVQLELYTAIAQHALAARAAALLQAFGDVHRRLASAAHWDAVAADCALVLAAHADASTGQERQEAAAIARQLRDFAQAGAAITAATGSTTVPEAPSQAAAAWAAAGVAAGVAEAWVVDQPPAEPVAQVVVWHGAADAARAAALAAQLARRGIAHWIVAEAALQQRADAARDAELRFRMRRARVGVVLLDAAGPVPTRAAERDWQQLLAGADERAGADSDGSRAGTPAAPAWLTWAAGARAVPAFLRQARLFRSPADGAAVVADAVAAAIATAVATEPS